MADQIAVLGLRSFWMQGGEAMSAIGALDYSKEDRKKLAKLCALLKPSGSERGY